MTFSFTGWDMLMWTGKKRKEKKKGGGEGICGMEHIQMSDTEIFQGYIGGHEQLA